MSPKYQAYNDSWFQTRASEVENRLAASGRSGGNISPESRRKSKHRMLFP